MEKKIKEKAKKKGKAPFKTGLFSCCLRWSITSRKGEAVTEAPRCPARPPQEDSCSQHFGLKET